MQALWLEGQTLSFRGDIPIPTPGDGEALVRVCLAGICSTDLEMVRGYYPFTGVPGHEFVGEVVEAPDAPAWVNRRVVGEINFACGLCETCRSGRPTHCAQRAVLGIRDRHGVFAEFLTLPLANLHEVPDDVPDEVAVFAEPLAAALEIQQQVQIRPTDRVLVLGAGRLGQLIAQTLGLAGCELFVAARYPRQQELLKARHIAVIRPDDVPARKMDVVVDATGTSEGFALGRQAVRPRGVMVLKSTYRGEVRINLSALVVDEITLVGSRCGPFAPALRLLASGQIDPSVLVDAVYPLSDGLAAFERAAHPGVLKVLLRPQGLSE
jgi:2-desacetyl-2-hydroxyethyl bacteriochlorophyllide A dehydrogenase